jgi:PIN domain nuclease of toxin-antitoxin system
MANKHVIDTHALIWFLEGNPKFGKAAGIVLNDPLAKLVLPTIALAEAIDIVAKGRTSLPDVNALLNDVLSDHRIELSPLTLDILQQTLVATAIPEMHDRLIAATVLWLESLGHEATLLTMDPKIIAAALVRIVW